MALVTVLLGAAPVSPVRAYVLEGVRWPANQPIVMGIQLGYPGYTLLDGAISWNQVAESALSAWNPYLGGGVQFTFQETAVNPTRNDGNNTAFFSPTIFGEAFGQDTLGITIYYYNPRTNFATEADVVFNSNQSFNSYRGDLRTASGKLMPDLRRVAIHEFGHVLGLDHVAQSAQAIMTPFTTNLDTVQPDDVDGVQALYGSPTIATPVVNSPASASGTVGQDFFYYITATNTPRKFQASGLPDGLRVDTFIGAILGFPSTSGTYSVTLGATNAAGTGTATLTLTIAAPAPVATVTATTPEVTIDSGEVGVFTVNLSAPQDTDTLVSYALKGTALNGTDYRLLGGTKKIKAGLTSKKIKIVPQGDLDGAVKKTVKLIVMPGGSYDVGTTSSAKMKIRAAAQ